MIVTDFTVEFYSVIVYILMIWFINFKNQETILCMYSEGYQVRKCRKVTHLSYTAYCAVNSEEGK